MENNRVKLRADVMWASLNRVNEMSQKYQVDLCNLSDAAVKAFEDMGITCKHKEEQGYFITCKSNNPIRAYDKDGDLIEGVMIGNGSKAVAMVGSYEWKWKNKEGVSPSLKKLIIEELVAFEGDGPEPDEMDEDEIL